MFDVCFIENIVIEDVSNDDMDVLLIDLDNIFDIFAWFLFCYDDDFHVVLNIAMVLMIEFSEESKQFKVIETLGCNYDMSIGLSFERFVK